MSPHSVDDAAAQLRRLLLAIPALSDDQPHRIADIAELVGVSVDTLAKDLRTLVTRFEDGPGGFMEGVRLAFASDTVQLESTLFRRPMGLTPSELGALELGLAVLARELPPHEAAVAARARDRVAEVSTAGSTAAADATPARAASLVTSEREAVYLSLLRTAIGARRKAALDYRSGSSPDGSTRHVHPYGLVYAHGHWYLIAHCERARSIRIFRLDRMTAVSVLEDEAEIPDTLRIEDTLRDGAALVNHTDEVLRVSYSPAIARWIAEHQAVTTQPDGSVTAEYPLLDDEWAVRHVLQYGPDAQALGPPRIQALLRERLQALLQEAAT